MSSRGSGKGQAINSSGVLNSVLMKACISIELFTRQHNARTVKNQTACPPGHPRQPLRSKTNPPSHRSNFHQHTTSHLTGACSRPPETNTRSQLQICPLSPSSSCSSLASDRLWQHWTVGEVDTICAASLRTTLTLSSHLARKVQVSLVFSAAT